jgi:hypothetical protein
VLGIASKGRVELAEDRSTAQHRSVDGRRVPRIPYDVTRLPSAKGDLTDDFCDRPFVGTKDNDANAARSKPERDRPTHFSFPSNQRDEALHR